MDEEREDERGGSRSFLRVPTSPVFRDETLTVTDVEGKSLRPPQTVRLFSQRPLRGPTRRHPRQVSWGHGSERANRAGLSMLMITPDL